MVSDIPGPRYRIGKSTTLVARFGYPARPWRELPNGATVPAASGQALRHTRRHISRLMMLECFRNPKRLAADAFGHRPAANALCAYPDCLVTAIGQSNPHPLQIRLELPSADAGYLGTDTAEVLGFTTMGDLIAQRWLFSANLALLPHTLLQCCCAAPQAAGASRNF